jgi:lysophospholipase L1-like esterase
VVVGKVQGVDQVFRWRKDIDWSTLDLGGAEFLDGHRDIVSADGAIIVGQSFDNSRSIDKYRVFRWDAENDSYLLLLPGQANAIADLFPNEMNGEVVPTTLPAVSADGNTIVGIGTAREAPEGGSWSHGWWAFRWTSSGGTSDAPQEPFDQLFSPTNISGNGGVVTGNYGDDYGDPDGRWAAIWNGSTGTVFGESQSQAVTSSYDGTIIGGWFPSAGVIATPLSGFLWTLGVGWAPTDTYTRPRSISEDDAIVTYLWMKQTGPSTYERKPWITIYDDNVIEPMIDYVSNSFGIAVSDMPIGAGSTNPYGLVSADGGVFSMGGASWIANVRPINYVSLGDSFSSGEGIPPFPGSDIPGVNNCHRSEESYAWYARPRGSRHRLEYIAHVSGTSRGFTFEQIACSGARTANVSRNLGLDWRDEPAQLEQDVVDDATDLVTITIGGNDAEFAKIAEFCAKAAFNCPDELWNPVLGSRSLVTLREWYFPHIREQVRGALVNLFKEIRNEEARNAAVVVLGYPLLYNGLETSCAGVIDQNERRFFADAVVFLNQTIREAAKEAGVHFAPGVAKAFLEHGRCGTQAPWIISINGGDWDGLSAPDDDRDDGLHPNHAGQQAYANVLSKFLTSTGLDYEHGYFESGLPKNPPAP